MIKQHSIKNLMLLSVMFIIGIGLTAGCSDKNKENENDNMVKTGQTSISENNNDMKGDSMHKGMHRMKGKMFKAELSGANEVPSNDSKASGMVMVSMQKDGRIHVKGKFSNLSSDYKASHIHIGAKGENGKVVQALEPDVNSNNTSGTFDASYQMDHKNMQMLKNDKMYINVHSKKYPKGEIRGQLKPANMNDSMNDDNGSMNEDNGSMN